MKVEELVRQKHAAEQALKEYLRFVSTMSCEEIELAMGRLADMLSEPYDADSLALIFLKGSILKVYLDLRVSGEKKQKSRQRSSHKQGMKMYYAAKGRAMHAQSMQKYEAAMCIYGQECAQWRLEIKKIPLLKRIFSAPPHPVEPDSPDMVDVYIRYSQRNANLSDYLIASATVFGHETSLCFCRDISRQKIMTLAP